MCWFAYLIWPLVAKPYKAEKIDLLKLFDFAEFFPFIYVQF
jgi:hypothetical protein